MSESMSGVDEIRPEEIEEELSPSDEEVEYGLREFIGGAFSTDGKIFWKIKYNSRISYFLLFTAILGLVSGVASSIVMSKLHIVIVNAPSGTNVQQVKEIMELFMKNPAVIVTSALFVSIILYLIGSLVIYLLGGGRMPFTSVMTAMGIVAIPQIVSGLLSVPLAISSPTIYLRLDFSNPQAVGAEFRSVQSSQINNFMAWIFIPWEALLVYMLFRKGMGLGSGRAVVLTIIAEVLRIIPQILQMLGLLGSSFI